MLVKLTVALAATILPGCCQDWNPQLAAQYLDSRQKDWFEWPRAKAQGGPCVSCHTGLTYLLARPSLRRAMEETQPTPYETGLLDGLRARSGTKDRPPLRSVETVFRALILARQDPRSSEMMQALDELWAAQATDGKTPGAWTWIDSALDPWEMPESPFFGAALAAAAIGYTPAEYRNQPGIREHLSALTTYLQREQQVQPLHNRLTLLWASSKLPGAMPDAARQKLIEEALGKQQADGGWAIQSLGPFGPHPQAPASEGSNSYATAFTVFVLEEAGVARSDAKLAKALDWLRSHQDPQSGAWAADSMNKQYPADSMQKRFMQDAATAFATLALISN